jgi:intracellular sulfur oxidation DsrE/DsrF family protein
MKDKNIDRNERRNLVSGLSMAAIAGAAVAATPAQAQSKGFEPARHEQDAWMDQIPGIHRVFIDTSDASGGTNAINYALNIKNEHNNAYGGSDDEMAMILCYRHASTPFAFNNAMWEKYGAGFAMLTGQGGENAPTSNNLFARLEGLAERGVHFAICSKATELTATIVARQVNEQKAEGAEDVAWQEIFEELKANAMPNAHFVPAGVIAATRSQEYGYSLLYSA